METIRQLYKETEKFAAQKIQIAGWIRTNRNSKNFGFLEINDGSFFKNVQVVYSDTLSNFEEIGKFSISSSLQIIGILVETPDAKQPFEIQATEVILLGAGDKEYPLQKKRHTFEYLRTIAHLRSRSNTFSAVFRVRSVLAYAIHKFFNERDFVYVHTPIITGSDCEGAGEMFHVTTLDMGQLPLTEEGSVDYAKDFFGKETSLTVSGQLAGETQAMAFRNIYTFGPTFRAEKSYTPRHAAEFWMVEPEIAFADIYDDMQLAEDMMKYVISYVLEECPEEMEFFNSFVDKGLLERLQNVLEADFVRITYTEAIAILEKSGKEFEYKPVWGVELQTEHERYLTEEVYKGPVIVRDYPKDVKAFYMRVNEDQKTVAAMDVLVPGVGELIGGSQREERLDVLEKRIEEMGLHKEDYWWYLDLRRYGTAKHAGFGLGFERAVMYLTGMTNIRDVIPFPRTTKSAEF